MQPVTLKNNQYSNTLWLSQAGLILITVMLLWLGAVTNQWLLLLLPVIWLALYFNHQTIKQQSKLQFSMRSNGQLVVAEEVVGHSMTEKKVFSSHDGDMTVEIKAFWHLPQVLLLKLATPELKKPVYLALFRLVLGPKDYSQLLIGLTQMNATLQYKHDYSK